MQITTVRAEHSYAYNPASSSTANTSLKTLPKIWESIQRCEEKFMENKIDPRDCPYLRPEVAESWIRSYEAGVNPFNVKLGLSLISRRWRKFYQKTVFYWI
ncbi:MAG: hypothetical protein ACOX7U_07730 [Desulfitobacteriia bacterium]|jgi:hypothetical protein